jgi:hypothetical protein
LQRLERQLERLGLARQLSEDCPNSARRYRANWNFSRAISAWATSASCAIVAMMRFSAARSSGRLSAVIGTPAVDQTCRRFGQWFIRAAAVCAARLTPPALAARFAAAFASRNGVDALRYCRARFR